MNMEQLNLFGGLSGIGVLAAGFGFAYAQFKAGGGKAKDDLVTTYKEQLSIEREKTEQLKLEKETLVQSHQTQLNELTKQLGILQGTVQAQDKKIKEYTDILQGRSPEQTQFMKVVLDEIKKNQQVTPAAQKYMRDTAEILSEVRDFMKELNKERKGAKHA